MNAVQRLDAYLHELRRRLRTHIYVRGAALASVGLVLLAAAFVWWWAYSGFAPGIAIAGRIAIALVLLTIVLAGLWWPLRVLRREEGAQVFERKLPQEQGRLATYLDARRRDDAADSPLIELLAEDAEHIAAATPADSIVSTRRVGTMAIVATLAIAALAALLTLAPGHWGYGARHLLLGADIPRDLVPVRKILVTPGNATVRRNGDLAIRATVEGFRPENATVYVRFTDQTEWERAPMQRTGETPTFEFKLYALRSPLAYYVAAEGTRSAEHRVTLADLPEIDRVRVTYRYPEWTGLAPEIDESSRDIRAVAGTEVTVEVHSKGPLEEPVLVHDGEVRALESRDGASAGTLEIERAGRYQIAARVAGERVVLSDEYSIEIVPDEKPVVQIERPGRDWRATNIEEVPVRVQAHDDFRLQNVELRYSINGGEWRSRPLDRNVKQTREQTLLALEQLGAEHAAVTGAPLLMPGDLVSYYAVAKDHKRSVQTDLFMVQVQPFERRFLQQNASGGGGMSDEQGAISERQREILLATWNLQRSETTNRRSREQLEDNARMLADMQATLAQQARTLAARTRARAQVEADERIKTFVESLERAAVAMDPAAAHLSAFKLKEAVPVEQQALQQLLRAEAAFREVQVSMQNDGGAQGSQSARDFSEMFELEMDVEKSQYESESQLAEQDVDKAMEEALRKLKELAERQEQLAQEANRNQTLTPEQRWRQEQLRREAEDLRRQLAALNRQQQSPSQSQSQPQQGSQSQQGQQSDSPSQANSSSGGQGSQNALEALDQALSEMQAANSQQQQDESGEQQGNPAQQASRNLQNAIKQLDRPRASGLGESLEELSERANRLASEQRNVENELNEALRQAAESKSLRNRPGAIDPERAQSLVENKQRMAEELSELQKDLRSSVHEHRAANEQAKQRLAEIVNDVESSDLMYRIRRSAAEIYYGRARDAAAREGIITESLQVLQSDLSEAAAQVGKQEREAPGTESSSDRLLADVADLRRRVEQRERLEALRAANGERGSEQPSSESGEPGEQASTQQAQGARQSPRGGASATTGNEALSAWDPVMPSMRQGRDAPGADSFARQSMSIADRAQRMRERTSSRDLTAAELASLREMARELRQLAGDPLAAESASMKQALEQLELTALAAVANRMRTDAARTSVPVGDSPQYREAVAEYYRRLGGS